LLLASEAVLLLASEAVLLLAAGLGSRIAAGLGSRIAAGLGAAAGLGSRMPAACCWALGVSEAELLLVLLIGARSRAVSGTAFPQYLGTWNMPPLAAPHLTYVLMCSL
jgi:hypothetical protein